MGGDGERKGSVQVRKGMGSEGDRQGKR